MRQRRRKLQNEQAWYHAMSRTVRQEHLFTEESKEVLRILIWKVAEFCGVNVVTYAILDNHFHVLVHVPIAEEISDAELLQRCKMHYRNNPVKFKEIQAKLTGGDSRVRADERQKLLNRMYDISEYMKEVKHRMTLWYNRHAAGCGTLWSERFKSVLVEGSAVALKTVAAYIDLNPVRAGIVDDPKDYRFCGYSEAVAGNEQALEGIHRALFVNPTRGGTWVMNEYRCLLFGKGIKQKMSKGVHFTHEQFVEEVVKKRGKLTLTEMLRCKLRFMTVGHVIGSKVFVKNHFTPKELSYCKLKPRTAGFVKEIDILETLRL